MTAKSAGMKVTEFFLGFGPKLWSFRRGETEYGVKAIPAGGLRAHHRHEQPRRGRSGRRGAAPTARSPTGGGCSVAVAGSTMHFLIALVLLLVRRSFSASATATTQQRLEAHSRGVPRRGGRPRARRPDRHGRRRGRRQLRRPAEYVRPARARRSSSWSSATVTELTLAAGAAQTEPATDEAVGFLGVGPRSPRAVGPDRRRPAEAVSQMLGPGHEVSVVGIGRLFSPDGLDRLHDSLRSSRARPEGRSTKPEPPRRSSASSTPAPTPASEDVRQLPLPARSPSTSSSASSTWCRCCPSTAATSPSPPTRGSARCCRGAATTPTSPSSCR